MSRIGKKPIEVPANVHITMNEQCITVTGPKGELSFMVRPEVRVTQENSMLTIIPIEEKRGVPTQTARELWGLTRTLISNMVQGVTEGYEKKLELEGVGYKAELQGTSLLLNVGFSHTITIDAPEGIEFTVIRNTIIVSGISKELVGEYAARIRRTRPAEPYKGKGFHYEGEVIRRKEGKKASGSEA